jgi:hyperosmotically inducible protein
VSAAVSHVGLRRSILAAELAQEDLTMFRKAVALIGFLLLAAPAVAADKSTGETIDDSTIATKTKTALLSDKKAPGNALNVEVYKGQVQLAGFVGSEEERAAAIAVAEKVTGVVRVLDGMVVHGTKRSVGRTLDDQTLQTKLKAKLLDSELGGKGWTINTEVREGEILMSGFVPDEAARNKAGEIAQGIGGVKTVHNFLTPKN